MQRYERELALPIHRIGESTRSATATRVELDGWVANRPTRIVEKGRRRDHRANKLMADFLLIDSEIALTFSSIALQATDLEKKRRTTKVAVKAYNAVMQLKENVELLDAQKSKLDANLLRLKRELQTLDQTV